MPDVIGVSFRRAGKLQLLLCGDIEVDVGDLVVGETKRGAELGRVAKGRHQTSDKQGDGGLRKVLRVATERDSEKHKANEQRAVEALETCARKIEEHGLPMRLIDAEYTLDRSRITFYFTAETRVDFRKLLRDLYASFKTRIQLLQVGVRDEAKMIGGIGPCGRQLCCCTFLRGFDPVAIKMAKTQGLSLNPSKISGVCGRLMCCLRYENEWYGAVRATLPRVGCFVECEQCTGKVTGVNVLKRTVTVRVEGSGPVEAPASEVTVVAPRGAAPPPAQKEQPSRAPAAEAKPAGGDAATSPPARRAPARRERGQRRRRQASGSRRGPARPQHEEGKQRRDRAQDAKQPARPAGETGSQAPRRRRRRPRRGRRRGPRTEFRSKKKGGNRPPKAS
ncbi:MAG: stage 0 sporulation family protein [Armatimonadota bacterium]|jgi:cell fate regulator YaaT (PSP1 superfamily)